MSMRIVIKPAGAVLIFLAMGLILFVVLRGNRTQNTVAAPFATVAVAGESLFLPDSALDSPEVRWYLVSAKSPPLAHQGDRVVRAELSLQVNGKPWSNMLIQKIPVPIKKGDRLTFHGYMRSSNPRDISVFAEEALSPHGKIITCQTNISSEWVELSGQATAKRDYPVDDARLVVHMGNEGGSVDIKGFELTRVPGKPPVP